MAKESSNCVLDAESVVSSPGQETVILSIQVGKPILFKEEHDESNGLITAFIKQPVEGPVWLGVDGLEGDGHADPRVHGGLEKAVLAYSTSHYPFWSRELGIEDLPAGAFAENFTLSGQSEPSVCIGDTYRLGDCLIQVSQPRQPCWKMCRRFGWPEMANRVIESNTAGWYYRVLEEGYVEAGMTMMLLDRPVPQWTITRVNDIIYEREFDNEARAALADCRLLSIGWRAFLRRRA